MEENKSGLIFAIEEFSTFDGPGIRTTVFLKGCPLRCSWCHNPEGQSFAPQILRSPNGCLQCGKCEAVALRVTGTTELVPECIGVCPRNLIRVSGIEYSPQELTNKILKNQLFYERTGGGVTFSGGEPLAQPEFLMECLGLLRGRVHRGIQTSGYCMEQIFGDILKETDFVLFDIKIIDEVRMQRYTGAGSKVILNNLDALVRSKVPFIIRIPLIPGVTDTEKNIKDIIDVLKFYDIKYAEALPYNKMAGAKYQLCNREYLPEFDPEKEVYLPAEEFKHHNIELKIL